MKITKEMVDTMAASGFVSMAPGILEFDRIRLSTGLANVLRQAWPQIEAEIRNGVNEAYAAGMEGVNERITAAKEEIKRLEAKNPAAAWVRGEAVDIVRKLEV